MPGAPGCGRQSFQLYSAEGSGRFREAFEARSSCGVSSRSSELSAVSDGGETRTTALFIARTPCLEPGESRGKLQEGRFSGPSTHSDCVILLSRERKEKQ